MELIDIYSDNLGAVIQVIILFFFFNSLLTVLWGTIGAKMLLFCAAALTILHKVGEFFNLEAIAWIGTSSLTALPIAFAIIFQAEIRRFILYMSRHSFAPLRKMATEQLKLSNINMINEIVDCVSTMTTRKNWHSVQTDRQLRLPTENTGALIALDIPGVSAVKEITETGIKVGAPVNSILLQTIFYKGTPLHDGGVVIQERSIVAASCRFPLSVNVENSSVAHTRHLAAIGMAESTRAVVIVVSEENGLVQLVEGDGVLQTMDGPNALRNQLKKILQIKEDTGVLAKSESWLQKIFLRRKERK